MTDSATRGQLRIHLGFAPGAGATSAAGATCAGGRLGQLGHDERPIAQGVAFERPPGGIACGLVAAQAVAEN